MPGTVGFTVNGRPEMVPDDGWSLLDVLRERLGIRSVKDGCSPQGQCGCCTVLVDGEPRVSCVTPVSRVAGRRVTTIEGLVDRDRWANEFCSAGASQCGFCTPGIVLRLAAARGPAADGLRAHLCRCTGWQTIMEAARGAPSTGAPARDLEAATRRATIEGRTAQRVGPEVALGGGGFADDTPPPDALVAVRAADGNWIVDETVVAARRRAAKVPGRRSTIGLSWPLDVPPGAWARTLQTTWVEPAYLELDASWCEPGGVPASAVACGGAFGGKAASPLPAVARRLADEHGRVVRVVLSREDVVRLGPKRPPIAAGIRADGSGVLRAVRARGLAEAVAGVAPSIVVEEADVAGPPVSAGIRAAGWAEAAVLLSAVRGEGPDEVHSPDGAVATAELADGAVHISVRCGDPLDAVVLRSYCIGAAHMALGWVRSEAIAVDDEDGPRDLTIRSFGILRATDMPPINVTIEHESAEPVNGSDAVFAAVAAAAWRHDGYSPRWPVGRR